MTQRLIQRFLAFGVLPIMVLSIMPTMGCDSGGPDAKVETNRLEAATKMRAYFTKTNGDYSKLSEAEKADFTKLCGGPDKVDRMWSTMKFGLGAAPARGQNKP